MEENICFKGSSVWFRLHIIYFQMNILRIPMKNDHSRGAIVEQNIPLPLDRFDLVKKLVTKLTNIDDRWRCLFPCVTESNFIVLDL